MTKGILSLLTLVFITGMISCKKSENDPLLSLKTRNSRITGNWVLTGYESTFSYDYQYDTTLFEYHEYGSYDISDGVFILETQDSTYRWDYTYEMEITKEGKVVTHRKVDEFTQEFKDDWWWVNGTRKKTGLAIWGGIYRIDRLSNKELVLVGDYYNKSVDPQDDYKSEGTYSYRLSFEKDKN